MTAFEEIFQMTSRLGLSTISKRAPHGRWRISIWLPEGANIAGANSNNGTCDLSICEVDADTPEQAAMQALARLKERLKDLSDRLEARRRETT